MTRTTGARSGRQPLEPVRHGVLRLLVDSRLMGQVGQVISTGEILRQHSACFYPAGTIAQDHGHKDDENDQNSSTNASEIHLRSRPN